MCNGKKLLLTKDNINITYEILLSENIFNLKHQVTHILINNHSVNLFIQYYS